CALPISAVVAQKAQELAAKIAAGLNLIGLLAVEMFLLESGELVVNELAPRPHNSGHFTLDTCVTSQFEQVIRAVCGLGLGSGEQLRPAVMLKDRKSTRLNSSHVKISYAVFCLKKKKK